MENKKKDAEEYIRELGLYITVPINMMLLFDTKERDTLNLIRHYRNLNNGFISISMISQLSGMAEGSVKKALKSLVNLGFIKKGNTCNKGTHYDIDFKKLFSAIKSLNSERNLHRRLAIVKEIRGEKN